MNKKLNLAIQIVVLLVSIIALLIIILEDKLVGTSFEFLKGKGLIILSISLLISAFSSILIGIKRKDK